MPPLTGDVAMLYLRTLGRLDIEGVQRDRADRLLRGPKRSALLVYLAAPPRRFHRRDSLAAYLWPELGQHAARHALRNALHQLRATLGGDLVERRGREEIAIAEGALQCDAAVVMDALAAQRPEEVVRRYDGEFLAGVHVTGASAEFGEWVEDRRIELRGAYIESLRALALRADAADDRVAAASWWRRLVAVAPHDTQGTLRLMEALHAAGNRAGALEQARTHAATLHREFDAAPDPQVVELADRLRAEPPHSRLSQDATSAGQQAAAITSPGSPATRLGSAYPLIGRDTEWERLRTTWAATTCGTSHFVLITGEAGIGKTRLAEELLDSASREGSLTARTRSFAAEGRLSFAPVAEWLRTPSLSVGLQRIDPAWRSEIARLLPELREGTPDPRHTESPGTWQRQRLFCALAHAATASGSAIVLAIDDLQWCDADTLEWLHYLLRFPATTRLLVVGTARVEDLTTSRALTVLREELRRQGRLTEIELGPLSDDATASLARAVAGAPVPVELVADLVRETEGQPLFVVESVQARWLDPAACGPHDPQGFDDSRSGASASTVPRELPPAVQSVIEERLHQLSASARCIAEAAAVIGRDFSVDTLALAVRLDEDTLAAGLDELCVRRILRAQNTHRFDFSHDKLREVAEARIGPARRGMLHRRAGDALAELHPTESAVTAQIAMHYECGGLPARAIDYYRRAADAALRVHASEEAIRLLRRGLALIPTLPDGDQRDRSELGLRIALCAPLRTSRGWASPALGEMTARTRALCDRTGEPAERLRVMCELVFYQLVRGTDLDTTLTNAEATLDLARRYDDESLLTPAHYNMANTLCQRGEFMHALEHIEQAIAHATSHQSAHVAFLGVDYFVLPRTFRAHILWHLGYPEQALTASRQALDYSEGLDHPFIRAIALAYDAMLQQFFGAAHVVAERARAGMVHCEEHGIPYYHAWATMLHGWALACTGDPATGIHELRDGLTAMRETGAGLRRSYYLGLQAEAYARAGQPDTALDRVREALSTAAETGEHWKDAELRRLEGDLLLRLGDRDGAERSCESAIAIAREQGARMLELRAALRLGELRRQRGDMPGARFVVADSLRGFTEGFETRELIEAGTFLRNHEVSGPQP